MTTVDTCVASTASLLQAATPLQVMPRLPLCGVLQNASIEFSSCNPRYRGPNLFKIIHALKRRIVLSCCHFLRWRVEVEVDVLFLPTWLLTNYKLQVDLSLALGYCPGSLSMNMYRCCLSGGEAETRHEFTPNLGFCVWLLCSSCLYVVVIHPCVYTI